MCVPFEGGLTIGYWKTHTGLGNPARDGTYDSLPVFLGIPPANGDPEHSVNNEEDAFAVFWGANGGGLGESMLKAQLLAAKLNAIKFPGFADAYLPTGEKVGDVMAVADSILDDLANGVSHTKSEITHIKDLLDEANNNSHDQHLSTCPQTQALVSSSGDYDGDGFDDERESWLIGTNSVQPCGPNGWPADLWSSGGPSQVTLQDLTSFVVPVKRLNAVPGDERYDQRWDLVLSRFGALINLQDLTALTVGPTAYPPMLHGQRAFGATCPN